MISLNFTKHLDFIIVLSDICLLRIRIITGIFSPQKIRGCNEIILVLPNEILHMAIQNSCSFSIQWYSLRKDF